MTKYGNIIYIPIFRYKELAKVLTGAFCYEGTHRFDEECGLRYISRDNEKYGHLLKVDSFTFLVVDEKKFLLAKLKYNLNDN